MTLPFTTPPFYVLIFNQKSFSSSVKTVVILNYFTCHRPAEFPQHWATAYFAKTVFLTGSKTEIEFKTGSETKLTQKIRCRFSPALEVVLNQNKDLKPKLKKFVASKILFKLTDCF